LTRLRYLCAYYVRMLRQHSARTTRPTNVTLRADLVEEAKALGVNISLAAGVGLEQAVAKKRAALWLEENAVALESYNSFVDKNGLPLEKLRLF
jgi:antitoxin CcdA